MDTKWGCSIKINDPSSAKDYGKRLKIRNNPIKKRKYIKSLNKDMRKSVRELSDYIDHQCYLRLK